MKHEPNHGGVIKKSSQLADNHAQILGALRHLETGQTLDAERVRPIVGHGIEVIEAIGVRH